MRLSEFIRANPDDIERAWEDFARTLTPFATDLSDSVLRNDLREILTTMADDMGTAQTSEEQQAKSKGHGPRGGALDRISTIHARARLASGFNLEHAISEYRALRSSILFLWVRSAPKSDDVELSEVTRFNETIDQAIAELVRRYASKDEMLNNQFVGALSHEIRNPLNAIALMAEMLNKSPLEEPQRNNVARIYRNVESIGRMIDDLAILVRSRMRVGLPLSKEFSDMGAITEEMLEQIKLSNPNGIFKIEKIGDLTGTWDKLRLQQMIFNIASNAVTHSSDKQARIVIREADGDVVLTISNRGQPIPEDEQQRIFEPFVHRGGSASARPSSGLGLGLFVVQEIVNAHKGSIAVVSNEIEGTTFTVRLPRIWGDQDPR
jgi:signal transduction histidine kinase